MEPALQRLIEVLPPPPDPTGCDVNWHEHEEALGITFPDSLKELIAVYGGCRWFGTFSILYPAFDLSDTASFRRAVEGKLQLLVEYEDEPPLMYPAAGGFFPFMVDNNGNEYFWKTEPADPNKWPMMQWQPGWTTQLKHATLAEFFLEAVDEFWKIAPEMIRVERIPPVSNQ